MPAIPLPPYAPDVASADAAVSGVARNVLPRADGYGPVLSPVPITLPLPEDCRGAVAFVSPAFGTWVYIAGTRTGLYRYNNSTTGWDSIGNPLRGYSMPDGDSWQFALYGSKLIAVHLGAPPQVLEVDGVQPFRDLGGGPPRARAVGIVGEFLVLAGLSGQPNAIRWSDLGNPEFWQPGLYPEHTADIQIFPEGGAVTGFSGGEFGIVFQERSIRRLTFNPGSRQVFDTSLVEDNRGAVAPWAICKVGARTFFLDRDGFYLFTGGISSPIGAERVNRAFLAAVDPRRLGQTIAVRDVYGPRVIFGYRTAAADPDRKALLDAGLVYDWQLDRWSALSLSVTAGLATATPPVSLDALPGTLESQVLSFDDSSYLGGIPALGFITSDNRLSLLTGPPLEATVETADAMLARPNRSFARSVRLDSDAEDWRAQVGGRESLARNVAVGWRPETAPTVERRAPCRSSARYHRVRVRIPAGTSWSYATAVEVDATAEGMR
ncbi:hypothetical protein [Methylobacterium nonmethylotrophicum]|uniref:Uncharacterized protein n=1 Tax=Methylobacterium nonmethylotrophicum TaxID=1141884 RepID=A0A4Z0NG49_9HYPH|nr:hypothetical protein [Methylobacterium nonmethylotrophicum]TGD94063.1 hypothetical protein EU555_32600 [Methylobacterium nonmethylotrophicum]